MIRLILILFTLFTCSDLHAQSVNASVVRLAPSTLPSVCNNGDLRSDNSDNYDIKICRENVWSSIIDSSTFSNPMTTNGDMIYQASGIPSRLAIGSANTVMTSSGSAPAWAKLLDANIDTAAAIAYSKLNLIGSIVNADINASAGIVDTKLDTISTAGKVSNSATTATALNTNSAIVARDGSGNFAAGTITATFAGNLTGNVTGNVTGDVTGDLTGNVTGDLTGNVTGDVTGNVTGNADTATALAANPTDCSSNQYANAIAANGDLTCAQPNVGNMTGTLPVANGGTGITSGTSGGILGYTANGTLASSSALTANQLVKGGGAGATPSTFSACSDGQVVKYASGIPSCGSDNTAGYTFVSKTTTYSAVVGDYILASSSSFTITLPTASGVSGQLIAIQHGGTSLSSVYTLNTTSSQTIGGIGSGVYKLYTNGEVLVVVSDGSNWQIVSHRTDTAWTDAGAFNVVASGTTCAKGTTSLDKFWWRRRGNMVEWRFEYVQTAGGTAGTGAYIWTLPTGLDIDTNVINTTGGSVATANASVIGYGTSSTNTNGADAISARYDVIPYNATNVMFLQTRTVSSADGKTLALLGGTSSGIVVNGNFGSTNWHLSMTGAYPVSGWQP